MARGADTAVDLRRKPGDEAQVIHDPLAAVGLYGMAGIATPVLASLVTGDPLLLVGAHGTAKTAMVEALARSMGLRFRAYDASKALFEDIIGFPNPAELGQGKVSYVSTQISIWDREFVLVDELSRATPSMQNKWLEVVRSRRVMGLEVESLRYVFAAMNPPGYLGARSLDPALVGRFAFIVTMPTVKEMSAREVGAVIRTVSSADAPACADLFRRRSDGGGGRSVGRAILQLAERARGELDGILEHHGQMLVDYVRALQALLRPHQVDLDGRRLSLMYRGLAAGLAVDEVRGRVVPTENGLYECVRHMLPGPALDTATPASVLYPVHRSAWEQSFGAGSSDLDAITHDNAACRVKSQTELPALLDAWEESLELLGEEDHHEVVSRVARPLRGNAKASADQRDEALAALSRLLEITSRQHADLPVDVVSRVFDTWRAVSGMNCTRWDEVSDLADEMEADPDVFSTDLDWLASRMALELTRDTPGDPTEYIDADAAAKNRGEIAKALKKDAWRTP